MAYEQTKIKECNMKTIDILDRNDLIKIAKKLDIEGSSNQFSKPYRKKDYIKNEIFNRHFSTINYYTTSTKNWHFSQNSVTH